MLMMLMTTTMLVMMMVGEAEGKDVHEKKTKELIRVHRHLAAWAMNRVDRSRSMLLMDL
jgi:hypothetical protein